MQSHNHIWITLYSLHPVIVHCIVAGVAFGPNPATFQLSYPVGVIIRESMSVMIG